ncbi:MAG: hypothetical protein ACPHRO_08960, partial [Nannocystaceae bacterium]
HGVVETGSGRVVFGEAPRGVPVEPHPGLVGKALTSAGLDRDAQAQASDGTMVQAKQVMVAQRAWPSLEDLSADAPPTLPGVPGRLDDIAWILEAAAEWGPPRDEQRRLRAKEALRGLLVLYEPIQKMRASGATYHKDGRGLFALTCGGAHLVQALFVVHRVEAGSTEEVEQLLRLWSLTQWRYHRELELLDDLLVQPGIDRRALLGQRLKLSGHFLETLRVVESSGLIDVTAEHRALGLRAESEVMATLAILEERGAFAGLGGASVGWSQADRDLVGDSLHAVRGLRLGG